jgi:hypothetical protein
MVDTGLRHDERRSVTGNWGPENRLTSSSFYMRLAPDAGGFFTGDYEGLAATSGFMAFFSQPHGTDPASVYFGRVGPGPLCGRGRVRPILRTGRLLPRAATTCRPGPAWHGSACYRAPRRGAWRSLVSALVWGVGARFPAVPLDTPKRLEWRKSSRRVPLGFPRFPASRWHFVGIGPLKDGLTRKRPLIRPSHRGRRLGLSLGVQIPIPEASAVDKGGTS